MSHVLITGGRGYIAEYIIKELKRRGHTVISIDNNVKYHKPVDPLTYEGIIDLVGDCRDMYYLKSVFKDHHIDCVIAAAALIGGIKYFHQDEYEILADNNRMMDATLRAAQKNDVRQVIILSSSMVYESATQFPVREGDELRIPPPLTSYGFQKLCNEYYAKSYLKQYGMGYTIVRPFNAAGKGEEAVPNDPGVSHVLPDFVLKAKASKGTFEILGDGKQVRCLTHCEDIARGIVQCVLNPAVMNDDINFVNPQPVAMLNLAKLVWKTFRPNEEFKPKFVKGFEHDVQRRVGSHEKAFRLLGWSPKWTIEQIVQSMR